MILNTGALFLVKAIAEIIGCYCHTLAPKGGTVWLLLPAAVSLALFAWLLTLHPTASGRIYAAYGGGAGVTLLGMAIIASGWHAQV